MTGQLSASFGFGLAGTVSDHLRKGELFVIIDALDEARMKANEAGFDAFIRDVAEIAKNGNGISFVLLGRTQTAETTWLLLDEIGIDASLITIQPFTREQAELYIEARIQTLDSAAAIRITEHRTPFVEARDVILDQLEKAVGGSVIANNTTVREFLGYAPVLETVAVLLSKEGNYQEFIKSLDSVQTGLKVPQNRPLAVLEHVVERLLEREQKQKLQVNIKQALEKVAADTGWSAWDILYSPDEQRARLLNHILGRNFNACPELPPLVRARYEEQLETWLREHPFLREGKYAANKVFESYLFAIAMREYLTPLSRCVEEILTDRNYKPSRLLADFYVLLGEQRNEEVVAERQIGLLYDSFLAGETDALRVRLSIDSGHPEETDDEQSISEGEFELVYTAPELTEGERAETRNFKIVDEKGEISFLRQLKEATIITRNAVVVGGAVDDFEVGPTVDIQCRKLVILSPGFVVRSGTVKSRETVGVVINANECESRLVGRPVVRNSLTVTWPGAQNFPWTEFAVSSSDDETGADEMHEINRRFRRIVGSLRSHSKGSLARFKDKIDHRRVLKNRAGKALLDQLLADGIMVASGNFYHWSPERADSLLKVSWTDLRNRQVTPEMKTYFARFISKNQGLF